MLRTPYRSVTQQEVLGTSASTGEFALYFRGETRRAPRNTNARASRTRSGTAAIVTLSAASVG
jgi:hypothetical protein